MINVLIVDDEPLVRASIQSFLPWEDYGFSFIGEAADGEQALSFLDENSETDIILLDIQMPVLNGIQTLEALQNRYRKPKVLVLSASEQYQNVRKAFQLGAEDYILKSEMDENNLLEHLRKVSERIEPQEESEKRINLNQKRLIADSLLEDMLSGKNLDLNRGLMTDLGFPIPFPCLLARFNIEHQSEDQRVKQILRLRGEDFFKQRGGGIVNFLTDCTGILLLPAEMAEAIGSDFCEVIGEAMNIDLDLTFSAPCSSPQEMKDQFEYLKSLEKGCSRIVHRAQQFIRNNYADPALALESVSSHVEVSRTHLSSQFSKETGMTFRDYLTHVRVDAARKLLEETNLKIYEICDLVGYTNVEHFSRIFKKTTGTTPNKYHR